MVLVNGAVEAKRGVFKAFRDFLNRKYATVDMTNAGEGKWRQGDRNQYGNRTRQYGDWLYHQDRPMFDELLQRTLLGRGEKEFDSTNWVK